MSKSRASKTKAAGLAAGADQYRKLYGNIPTGMQPFCGWCVKLNRMMRRAAKKP